MERRVNRKPRFTPYLVMELVPTVQVKRIKLLHILRTDHTLIFAIHERLGGSLLRGRSHGNRSPDGNLHL